ncbi:MAG: prephenate dehydrogenase/arogenate dehydrogenase family protein [Flavobacteriales bacterium]
MTIGIIGLGLIGRSMALALRLANFGKKIIGVDQNLQNTSRELELKLVEKVLFLDTLSSQSEVSILTIHVDRIKKLLLKLLEQIPNKNVVLNTGSIKDEIYQSVADYPKRDRFVVIHPIAGAEYSSPETALTKLFERKITIFYQAEHSTPDSLQTAEKVYPQLSISLIKIDSKTHDLHLSYISHLSHILSFGLARTILVVKRDERNIFHLVGSMFNPTVRLAKSYPEISGYQSSDRTKPTYSKQSRPMAIKAYIYQPSTFRRVPYKRTTPKRSTDT